MGKKVKQLNLMEINEKLLRKEYIEKIEMLYPPNDPVGVELLMRAIAQTWKSLPTEILKKYAQLCVQREQSL